MPELRPSLHGQRLGERSGQRFGQRFGPILGLALSAAVVLGADPTLPAAEAFFDAPAPKVDCSKRENRSKPQCKKSDLAPQPAKPGDEVFFAAYGLARAGQYAAALDVLRLADQSDPRVLNYQGFATRKLGDVDAALPYYRRALAIDPNYVLARAYMGEAYLQKGDAARARDELGEIERRCGRVCAEYVDLALEIDAHERGVRGG